MWSLSKVFEWFVRKLRESINYSYLIRNNREVNSIQKESMLNKVGRKIRRRKRTDYGSRRNQRHRWAEIGRIIKYHVRIGISKWPENRRGEVW